MRIAYSALTAIPGLMGGTETYARELLLALGRDCPDLDVTVIANTMSARVIREYGGDDLPIETVERYRASRSSARRFASMARAAVLPGLVAREINGHFDVVHYPFTVPLPRLTGTPTVVSLHDVQHVALPQMFSRAERIYRSFAYGTAAKKATRVTTLSEASKSDIVEIYDVDPEKIDVNGMGANQVRFNHTPLPDEEERRHKLQLPERFIFYPANLWPHKNHDILLAGLGRSSSKPVLILTGATYDREAELMATAERFGVRQLVRHLGFVDHDDLPVLYRAASALVFPSLFEGFGVPPIEAMASRCRVASSAAASLAEVCAEHAVMFDPHDPVSIAAAIDEVVGPTDAAVLDAAAQWAARFTWERSARGHATTYARAAAASA